MFNDINKRYAIQVGAHTYFWSIETERALVIKEGFPYEIIDALEVKTSIPTSHLLSYLNLDISKENKPITNIVEVKSIMELIELYDYGVQVFNGEVHKFKRWLKKPNVSLNQRSPENVLSEERTVTPVKNVLDKIEYGGF